MSAAPQKLSKIGGFMANAALMLAKTHAVCCGVVPVLASVGLGGLIGDSLESRVMIGLCLVPVTATAGLGVEKAIHYVMHRKKDCDHDHPVFTWKNFGKQALAATAGFVLMTGVHAMTHDHAHDHDHHHDHKQEFHVTTADTCDHMHEVCDTMVLAQDSANLVVPLQSMQLRQR